MSIAISPDNKTLCHGHANGIDFYAINDNNTITQTNKIVSTNITSLYFLNNDIIYYYNGSLNKFDILKPISKDKGAKNPIEIDFEKNDELRFDNMNIVLRHKDKKLCICGWDNKYIKICLYNLSENFIPSGKIYIYFDNLSKINNVSITSVSINNDCTQLCVGVNWETARKIKIYNINDGSSSMASSPTSSSAKKLSDVTTINNVIENYDILQLFWFNTKFYFTTYTVDKKSIIYQYQKNKLKEIKSELNGKVKAITTSDKILAILPEEGNIIIEQVPTSDGKRASKRKSKRKSKRASKRKSKRSSKRKSKRASKRKSRRSL